MSETRPEEAARSGHGAATGAEGVGPTVWQGPSQVGRGDGPSRDGPGPIHPAGSRAQTLVPSATSGHTLALRDLHKRYGRVVAVDGVSLDVPRGQFLTLLGPSGSGKTTILMAIAGFTDPSSGEILLDDRAITRLPPEKRNFGMVFQGYALFPHLNVFENVAFSLRVRGSSKPEVAQRVGDALDLVQLRGLADRLPRQLSGGQQQRVALARALVFAPHILLLDEPLSSLDKKLRAELQWELKLLHHRLETTFIYVTHDQEEALSMSDRVAIIRDGRLVQVGAPRELYERPATRFVAEFLGKSNFIRGRTDSLSHHGFTYRAGDGVYAQVAQEPGIKPGIDVLIAVRPEKIRVSPRPWPPGTNQADGEIATWNYYGMHFALRVRTTTLGELTVTAPAWRSEVEPQAGRRVWLSWDPDASVVVAED